MIVQGIPLEGEAPVDIEIREGIVQSVSKAAGTQPDQGSPEAIIAPTLFDIQVNGAFGIDLLDPELTAADVERLNQWLAQWGVARWIPTLITAPFKTLARGCRFFTTLRQDRSLARALPGIHLEGPYISPEDGPRGAHGRAHVRPPDIDEFDRLNEAADGAIRYVTLAPEVEGAESFIRHVHQQGVVVALGHHQGSADDIARAVDAGARLSTHLGNGMASQMNRHQNPLWPQLAEDRLSASLIADGVHLPPAVLKTFVRAKGPNRIILTSDITPPAGLPPGPYKLGDVDVEVTPSGRVYLPGTDLLAGSGLMLLQGVVNAAHYTDLSLEQAFAAARDTPARLFGVDIPLSQITVGAKADFIVFHRNADTAGGPPKAIVDAVWIDGTPIDPPSQS